MIADRTPTGASTDVIEEWLARVGEVREHPQGFAVVLTPALLREYAEWVAACQREAIAQVLERLPRELRPQGCADYVRRMRADH